MGIHSAITATGIALGARRVENDELGAIVNSSDEWIRKRTGIEARYFVEDGQTNWGLALEASQQALATAGLEANDLDAIVYATLSPDMAFPGSGVMLQDALGADEIPALDVRNQCSGFLYGLSVADAWIRAGSYRRVLLVGSEIHSTGLDLTERGRDVAVLFGDGAGAAIVEAVDEDDRRGGRVLDVALGADGSGAHLLRCERPGAQFHPSLSAADIEAGHHFPKMEGRTVFRRAVEMLTRETKAAMDRLDLPASKIVFVPHQSNKKINEMVAQRLGIDPQRVVHTIDQYGNTTAASIPMALHSALDDGMIEDGDVALLAAFGSGLTWGTGALRFARAPG